MTEPFYDAIFGGPNDEYRYVLVRDEQPALERRIAWVMLNPSTATARLDSPTMRKVTRLSRRLGHLNLTVTNLFALRSPRPEKLLAHPDPVGGLNDFWTHEALSDPDVTEVIFAWGSWVLAHPRLAVRGELVAKVAADHGLAPKCLGRTRGGAPRHPLYVDTLELQPYE